MHLADAFIQSDLQ